MTTHTIDQASRPATGYRVDAALWRVAATAALSVLFALIWCAAPIDHGQGLAAPAVSDTPAVAQASTTNRVAD